MGRSVLITNALSDLGEIIARDYASHGYDLMLADQDPRAAENLVNELSHTHGVKCAFHGGDLAKAQDCEDLRLYMLSTLGSIDVLIDVLPLLSRGTIEEIDDSKLVVSLQARWNLHKTLLPIMRKQNAGRVLTVASILGAVGNKTDCLSVSVNHALAGLIKAIAADYAAYNISANFIGAGYTLTDQLNKQIEALSREKNISFDAASALLIDGKHLKKAFVRSSEILKMAHLLTSFEVSSISGAFFPIDCGWSVI